MNRVSIVLIFFSTTDKVLFETSFSAGFGFALVKYGIPFFYGSNKVIDIFSDKDFENECSSFFQENICDIENS